MSTEGRDTARPETKADPERNVMDEVIDEALDAATGRGPSGSGPRDLKRQWDDEMEAELEAAMAGFDPDSIDVNTPGRTRATDRAHVPQSARGQEATPGPRTGKVIGGKGKYLFVDLGGKSEGAIPTEQFGDDPFPEPGSLIEVFVDRYDPAEGLTKLNLKGAAVEADWDSIRRGMLVEARVIKTVKGGVEGNVDGMRGFMPISQIDMERVEDGSEFLNQKVRVLVTEANPRQKNLVVSRRELLERERAEQAEKTWNELEEGQILKGKVRSIKEFGAFVDVGGVDGLIHVSDLSWVRGNKVEDIVRLGDEVEVKVLKIDRETRKVGLGLKQLAASPWDTIEHRYARGQTVNGKVTKLMDFGAFVELEPGIEGLIHISELSPNRVRRVRDIVQIDQEVEARILDIDADSKRISLSIKQLPKDTPLAETEAEDETEEAPLAARPPRKVPLKGGLGDTEPEPFGKGN
ncbi:hypothetical protein BH23PLA1_BH23PLA1_16150 [soil metagenome]